MNSARQSVASIMLNYRCWTENDDLGQTTVEALGNNGGYSGAQLWKITLPNSNCLCLRRWPKNPAQRQQIDWIHRVLHHFASHGNATDILPLPYLTHQNQKVINADGYCFELTDWLSGKSDFHENPNPSRIRSAAEVLARFHQSSQLIEKSRCAGRDLRGIRQRVRMISDLKNGLLDKIEARLGASPFAESGRQLAVFFRELEPTISHQLARLSNESFWQQVCIRDIWHDHVLFDDDRVSGVIDFGAMGIDNVATDISRLFGSLFQNSIDQWRLGLAAYQSICELSDLELELIDVYDRSSIVLAGMNWLKWILIENRKFDSFLPIIKRMERLTQRMRDWI